MRIVCPGLAEGWEGLAGVPEIASPWTWLKEIGSAADVPPAVSTVTGPGAAPVGTVR